MGMHGDDRAVLLPLHVPGFEYLPHFRGMIVCRADEQDHLPAVDTVCVSSGRAPLKYKLMDLANKLDGLLLGHVLACRVTGVVALPVVEKGHLDGQPVRAIPQDVAVHPHIGEALEENRVLKIARLRVGRHMVRIARSAARSVRDVRAAQHDMWYVRYR